MKGDTVGKTYTGNVLMLKLILIDFQHNKWLPLSCGQGRTESFRLYLAQGHSQPVFRHNKPAQQAFPCSFGARNEERESKTARKMGRVKKRGGGEGVSRRFSFFPYPLFHFCALAPFLARPRPKIPSAFARPKPDGNASYAGYDIFE